MNTLTKTIFFLFLSFSMYAQGDSEWPALDASPLDMAYYPASVAWRNYLSGDERTQTPKLKVVYSRPMKKGRDIFGGLVPYGQEWRLGANEATILTAYQSIGIGHKTLTAGAYSIFAEVNESEWTFHISTETNIWGNANRNADKTVASYTVPVTAVDDSREALAMAFQQVDEYTVNLVVEWDNVRASLPIKMNPVEFRQVDVSQLDMAHYPSNSAFTNYLKGDEKNITPKIQVTYGRPAKKGRNIFGELVPYGETWRVGANESTEIALYQDVMIGDTKIAKGRYALFADVEQDKWDVIFSKDYPTWGAHDRDTEKDVAKISADVTQDSEVVENLSIIFEDQEDGSVHMIIAWDQTRVAVPMTFVE